MMRSFLIHTILVMVVITAVDPSAAGTFTKLNEGDPHVSWAHPRINNLGHVAMIRGNTTLYGGNPYLWTDTESPLVEYPGCSVAILTLLQPQMEINDHDRIAFQGGSNIVRVANTNGVIPMGPAPISIGYIIDINDNNRVAARAWNATYNNIIYSSDDPYTTYDQDVGPTNITSYQLAYNNNNQIAWTPPGTSTMYRFTPGIGSEAIGPSNYAPFDMDDQGRIIHVRDQNKIMLNNLVLRQSDNIWYYGSYSQPRISNNGKHVVWTEYNGSLWDLWAMVDGIPTNITQASYHRAICPDVNDDGLMVFAALDGFNVSPYRSDIYLYSSDEEQPIIYNGHFEGETLFGWNLVKEGAAEVELTDSAEGFSVSLTSGSPAGIEQLVDLAAEPVSLVFAFDFLTINGTLTVSLDGFTVASLTSDDDTEVGFTTIELPLNTALPLDKSGALLSLKLDDETSATVLLDNIEILESLSAVGEETDSLPILGLGRVYPNPFTSNTNIWFSLDRAGPLEISVYDLAGRRVALLLDEYRDQGPSLLTWDGRDNAGNDLATGVYLIRIRNGERHETRKVQLVR